MKIKFAPVALLIALAGTTASAQEWQHENPDFDATGKVTIKSLAGVTSQLINSGQQGLQSSASPVVLNVGGGGSYEFDIGFALQSGEYLVRETNLNNWLKFTKADFTKQFKFELEEPIPQLSKQVVARSTATYSASGSGSATSWNNGVGSAQVSCSLGSQSASDSAGHMVSVNLNSGEAQVFCGAAPLAFGVNVTGTLYVYASVNTEIYNGSRQCSSTIFNGSRSNCFEQCTGSGSGSTSQSCSASDEGWVLWTGGKMLGFSSSRHYLAAGGVSTNKKTISFSGISKAFINPVSNIFYIQRGNTLNSLDPADGNESLITQLTAGDTPTKIVSGLTFTPNQTTPPP
jgi:hypothetical protein